jgi:protein-tyrosine phosphatase
MIDIHSHILPELDDGAQNLDQAIEMAKAAVHEGIHTVIATPHHANGRFLNEAADVRNAVRAFNDELQERRIPLKVLSGQEIRIYNSLLDDIRNKSLMPLHDSKYILIEFPSAYIPQSFDELLHELQVIGLITIIAHPERNQEIVDDPDKLYKLVEKGALSQVTSHSLTGRFGRRIQKVSMELCRRNLAHVIASDSHNVTQRPFALVEAYQVIDRELGSDLSEIYRNNAIHIIHNNEIHRQKPLSKVSRWFHFRK